MKPRTMLLLVVAVFLGLGAAYMAAKLLSRPPEAQNVMLLVAREEIPQGTYLKEPDKFFVEKEVPKAFEPKIYVSKMDDLKGRVLNKTLPEGQFCTEGDLLPREKQIVIPTTDGKEPTDKNRMLAVAVRVTPDALAGGFVIPGSHVDVIYYDQVAPNKFQSRTILYDVAVLGADNLSQLPPGENARNSNTITLAVTPEQCERLVLASDKTQLHFAYIGADEWGPKKATERKEHELEALRRLGSFGTGEPGEETVNILVAKVDLKEGDKVEESLFKKVSYPVGERPLKAVTDFSKVAGLYLSHALAKNKFLTESDLKKADNTPIDTTPDGHVLDVYNGGKNLRVLYPDEPGSYGRFLSGVPISGRRSTVSPGGAQGTPKPKKENRPATGSSAAPKDGPKS